MRPFSYDTAAELFPAAIRKKKRAGFAYRRFGTAAEAVRFAIEELPADSLNGAYLQVEEARFDQSGIRTLYESEAFPWPRRRAKPKPAAASANRCSPVRWPNGLAPPKSKRKSSKPCASDSGGISRPSWSMIGPRGCAPPNVAREVLPERAVRRGWTSLSCMVMTWETHERDASCVMPSLLCLVQANAAGRKVPLFSSRRYVDGTGCGCSSAYLCVSHEDAIPGIRPTRP